jgi:nucleotide-binding universal stress UspA family protein
MTAVPMPEVPPSVPDPSRVLIAVHGYEADGWARDACRAVPPGAGVVRVLVVLDVIAPSFTSLLPAARRRYGAARVQWDREEEERSRPVVDEMLAALLRLPEVVRLVAARSDPARTLAEHAAEWLADVIIVGRDRRPRAIRALLGAVHERVVRFAPCAVLVPPTARGAGEGVGVHWRAAVQGGRG